jgi:hypothetical protein
MTKKETAGLARQRSDSAERRARQAAALRENLHKRKAQRRQRLAAAGPDQAAEAPLEPGSTAPDASTGSAAKDRSSA